MGFWRNREEIEQFWQRDRRFEPAMPEDVREKLYAGWKRAVERARAWEEPAQ